MASAVSCAGDGAAADRTKGRADASVVERMAGFGLGAACLSRSWGGPSSRTGQSLPCRPTRFPLEILESA